MANLILYKVLALLRDSMMNGSLYFKARFILLIINLIMVFVSFMVLHKSKI